MNETISVIVPNYNNEKYLKDCVESIFKQTYQILEVIVVDDCSTDNSVQILTELQGMLGTEKLKLLSLKKNMGVSHARNVGLEVAKGEYITFLDADDMYADEYKISNEMSLISRYREEGKDVAAYSEVLYIDEEGKQLEKSGTRKSYSGNLFMLLLNTVDTKVIPRDYCVKTECARGIGGYREDMSLYEDYEFTLRLSKQLEFADTQKAGTAYRLKKNGLSDKSWKVSDRVFLNIFMENVKSLSNITKLGCVIKKVFFLSLRRFKAQVYNWVIRKDI